MRFPLICALSLVSATAAGQDSLVRFRGYAYELDSGRFLYTEQHAQRIAGERWLGGAIDYYAPDGALLARKTLDFTQDPYIPAYRLDIKARGGYMEAITAVTPERVDMALQAYGAPQPRTASVRRTSFMVADSGFHVLLRERFAELLEGRTVTFAFGVAGNLDRYRFRARRIGDGAFEGKPAVRIRVEPDSVLRWLVKPLEVTYEPGQRQLVEYRGVSNLHDPATGEPYHVRVVYPSAPPADVPPLPESVAR